MRKMIKKEKKKNKYMINSFQKLVAAFLFILFFGISSFAAFTEDLMKIGVGARPMGMGKAFVAVSDDGNSAFVNPAGLAELKKWQVTSMYVSLLEGDLPYTLVSGSMPFWKGTVGLGLIYTGVSDIPSPTSEGISYFNYYDKLMFLSYGAEAGFSKKLSWGANIKFFNKGFSGGVTSSGSGFGLDLGIKYKVKEWINIGANLQNILNRRSDSGYGVLAIVSNRSLYNFKFSIK